MLHWNCHEKMRLIKAQLCISFNIKLVDRAETFETTNVILMNVFILSWINRELSPISIAFNSVMLFVAFCSYSDHHLGLTPQSWNFWFTTTHCIKTGYSRPVFIRWDCFHLKQTVHFLLSIIQHHDGVKLMYRVEHLEAEEPIVPH